MTYTLTTTNHVGVVSVHRRLTRSEVHTALENWLRNDSMVTFYVDQEGNSSA